MAAEINYTLVRLTLETILVFDGNKDILEIFISAADNFYNTYAVINDDLRKFVLQALLGKLKGNPLIIIGSRAELNTWPLVREELRNVYGEGLSLDNLEQMLMTCTLQRNEHYQNFGKRLQLIRSRLCQKINMTFENIMDAASKLIHIRQYYTMACKIFVRNLDRRLRDKIIVQNPLTLEAAMAHALDDENFELFLTPNPSQFKQLLPRSTLNIRQSTPSSNPPSRPQQRPQIQNPRQPFSNQYFQSQIQQPQFSNQQFQTSQFPGQHSQNFRQNFPSQPINIQPRQVTHHFPTNRQTFGPPQNVWKPQNKPNNNPTPVPMSVTSKIPPNLPNRQNHQYYEPMSTTSRFTAKPPFHGNMETNNSHEIDTGTAINDNSLYLYEEQDVNTTEEFDYTTYDTASYELQDNESQLDFLTVPITNNQT